MEKQFVDRVSAIASELLRGERVSVRLKREDYYTVEVVEADGRRSNFPPIWLPGSLSDGQIRDKLSREFRENLHPESAPDDASMPNLQTEGKRH